MMVLFIMAKPPLVFIASDFFSFHIATLQYDAIKSQTMAFRQRHSAQKSIASADRSILNQPAYIGKPVVSSQPFDFCSLVIDRHCIESKIFLRTDFKLSILARFLLHQVNLTGR